jgi:hypothetical protein
MVALEWVVGVEGTNREMFHWQVTEFLHPLFRCSTQRPAISMHGRGSSCSLHFLLTAGDQTRGWLQRNGQTNRS